MRMLVRLSVLVISLVSVSFVYAGNYTSTKHPIVLVHGFMGFDKFSGIEYFYRVPSNLTRSGASVHVVKLSALNNNEVRGEQLVQQIEGILAVTGEEKVNLISHSQGGLAARYAASVVPDYVASVTTIATPNSAGGFPLGEWISQDYPPGTNQGDLIAGVISTLAQFIDFYSGSTQLPQDYDAFLRALSDVELARFNASHPQALVTTECGVGASVVDDIYYYSWSGAKVATNLFDLSDYAMIMASEITGTDSDGMVTRCGSHLGNVIRDNYPMNHLDEINHLFGFYGLFSTNPMVTYRSHANRLKNSGL